MISAPKGAYAHHRGEKCAALLRILTIGVVCALINEPTPAEGQIVNTLRRWSNAEEGLSGRVSVNFAVASGNTDYLEFSGGGSTQFVGGGHRVRLLMSETFRRANDQKIAESFLAHLRHNYRLTDLVSTLVFFQHQSNPFRRLERRTLVGAGTRLDVIREETWEGSLGASYMVETEKISDDPTGEAATDGRWSFFASAIGDLASNVRLDLSTFYQPRVSDLGDARAYTAATLRIDVVGELDLITRFDLTYDSRPPVDVETTDIRFSTGLIFDF